VQQLLPGYSPGTDTHNVGPIVSVQLKSSTFLACTTNMYRHQPPRRTVGSGPGHIALDGVQSRGPFFQLSGEGTAKVVG